MKHNKKCKYRRHGDTSRGTLRKVARSANVLLRSFGKGLLKASRVWTGHERAEV